VEFPPEVVVSRFLPKPGWTRTVERDSAGRIAAATWTDGSLEPEEYEDFSVVLRNPRQPGKIAFKAYQTYADGSVVQWIGPENAEEPAGVVTITTATTSSATSIEEQGQGPAPSRTPSTPSTTAPSTLDQPAGSDPSTTTLSAEYRPTANASSGSDLSLFVAMGAVALALIALALAIVAMARRSQAV
jgi:uncharacterized protein YcnI